MRTLQALDAQRSQAFWTLNLDALSNIYIPGSSPWTADRALMSEYRQQNVRVQGLRITIDSITITRHTRTTITLRTTDQLTGGEVVDHSGTKTPLPQGPRTTRLITLTNNPTSTTTPPSGPWRITTITRA
ncbi:hypothetical protein GCM10009630_56710 [Kribbella jejuensis]|uniref:hypothetical protein n=1 Tax=Kribbella jejuensis TaxID=236068 RepID=UPI0011507219|nr:hypothetical protein [Kribbella jejuensis]